MDREQCLSSSRTSGRSSDSCGTKYKVQEMNGPFGPIGRCPTIVLPKSNRLVRHKETYVDDLLFATPRLPQPLQPKKPLPSDLTKELGTEHLQTQIGSRPSSAGVTQCQVVQGLKTASNNLRPTPHAKPPSFSCNMLGRPVATPPSNTSLSVMTQSKRQIRSAQSSCEALPRSGLSAIQKWQTRYRPARTRKSEIQFGLFAPLSDSLFWSAMEEWYEQDAFAKGKHGMFDTDAVQSVNDTDVIQCLKVNRKAFSKK